MNEAKFFKVIFKIAESFHLKIENKKYDAL